MKVHVHIVQGPAANRTFTIEENSRCVVGRDEAADFRIENDELISRQHFAIEFDGISVTLTDLGSTNGTFVGSHPLVKDQPVRLKDGQSFVAGRKSVFAIRIEKPDKKRWVGLPAMSDDSESDTPTNLGSGNMHQRESSQSIARPKNKKPVGNFSQSIQKAIRSDGSSEPGDLLRQNPSSPYVNLGGGQQGPPTSAQEPDQPRAPFEEFGDQDSGRSESGGADFGGADFAAGSIANPAEIGGINLDFPPLPRDPPPIRQPAKSRRSRVETKDLQSELPPDSIAPPGGFDPTPPPGDAIKPGQGFQSSPFESIDSTPEPLPEDVQPNQAPGAASKSGFDADVPVPPFAGMGAAAGIGPSESTEFQSPNPERSGSIGLPGQIPVVKQRLRPERNQITETLIPPGKVGFRIRQQHNGLFFYSGQEVDDVPRVLNLLRNRFDVVYCAHLFRAGIDLANSEPASGSNIPADDKSDVSEFDDPNSAKPTESNDSPFETSPVDPESPTHETLQPSRTSIQKIGIPLFDWLPKEARWDHPLLLNGEEFSLAIEDLWQKDALVCFFGSSAKQLTDHCLELVRTNINTGKKSGAVFGFCWPSVLNSVLESQGEKSVGRIFAGGVAAILLEDPTQETAWNIVSKNDLCDLLASAGFVRQDQPQKMD